MLVTTIVGTGHTVAITTEDGNDLAGHAALVARIHSELREAGQFSSPVSGGNVTLEAAAAEPSTVAVCVRCHTHPSQGKASRLHPTVCAQCERFIPKDEGPVL